MAGMKKLANGAIPWFGLGLVGVFLVSMALRFWGLGRFNTLVFDEVYYVKFANNYLTRTPFFDGHPPLSKYLIAVGIWIGQHFPWVQNSPQNTMAGSPLSPFSYRWLNALMGSLMPLLIAGIAYQLTHRRSYAFIAGLLTAADGLFLVESRYALNNIHLLLLGLLGQWFLLLALSTQRLKQRYLWLTLAGIGFGATAAIKWNGLGFLLGIYLLWIVAWIVQWLTAGQSTDERSPEANLEELNFVQRAPAKPNPLQNLTQLNWLTVSFYLGAIPALVYSLSWIPHLQLNPTPGFLDVHQKILAYHENVGGNTSDIHPYCSPWYSWLGMVRPVAYFYQTAQSTAAPVPALNPPLPARTATVVYDVHAIGNPILWWLSTVAIALVIWKFGQLIYRWISQPETRAQVGAIAKTTGFWTVLFILVNYGANLLPWLKISRCTFLYHYMSSYTFAILAIAGLIDRWLHSSESRLRAAGVTTVFLILVAFVFWLPIYLGLPISMREWQLRIWFPSWI